MGITQFLKGGKSQLFVKLAETLQLFSRNLSFLSSILYLCNNYNIIWWENVSQIASKIHFVKNSAQKKEVCYTIS